MDTVGFQMNLLDKLTAYAVHYGSPKGQVRNFLLGKYVPQPKQLQFHAACRTADSPEGPTEIGFGGARGPGKSHAMFAQVTLDDCQRFPGLKTLMLRKVGRALKESAGDLRLKVLKNTQHHFNKSTGEIVFPNRSRVILGHFRTETDIDTYIGLEYDLIAIEECTTLSGDKYKMIRTCCRTSKSGWRPRMYSNANPGGIGHGFYHRRFIQGEEGTAFIPATYRDNAFLDEGYLKSLESLTGWRRRAWLDGDWNIHAGTYFTNFQEDVHVIENRSFQYTGAKYYLAIDYGFQHPTAAVLLATLGENVYVIDEYRVAKTLTGQHCKSLTAMLAKWGLEKRHLSSIVLGQDAWQKGKDGTTVAEEYQALGWNVEPAIMARVQGAQEILRRLGDTEVGINPTLWIFKSCFMIGEQLPQLQHDPRRPEDVLKVDVDMDGEGGDDLYDALRYGLQSVVGYGALTYGALSFPR